MISYVIKLQQGTDCSFSIHHYAANVEYLTYGFILNNRDSMAPDVALLLRESQLSVVAESFLAGMSSTGQVGRTMTMACTGS
jgi:myosin heavy subunit